MSDDLGGDTPVALIPGDPETVDQTAQQIASWGESMELAAEGLGRIDTSSGWSGQAAEAFRRVFDNQPGKWKDAAEAFRGASQALGQYAGELDWAQHQAATALTQWHSGDHQGAHRTLDQARSRLADAAATATRAISTATDMAPPKPGLLSEIGHAIENAASSAWHGLVEAGEDTAGAIASYANAAIQDPGALATLVGGALLTAAGATGEFGGIMLDLSVIGAPAGVAVNAGSALVMAGGIGTAAAGALKMMMDANGPDRVNIGQSSGTGGSGGDPGGDDPNFGKLSPSEQDTLVRLQQERPDLDLKAAPRDRYGQDPGHEYVDNQGRTYDQMGAPPRAHPRTGPARKPTSFAGSIRT